MVTSIPLPEKKNREILFVEFLYRFFSLVTDFTVVYCILQNTRIATNKVFHSKFSLNPLSKIN